MLQQERDDRLLVAIVGGIQLEFLEALVLADQVGDGTVEQVDYFAECRPARVPSAGIVVQGDAFHRFRSPFGKA
jgi:hypothetical protein